MPSPDLLAPAKTFNHWTHKQAKKNRTACGIPPDVASLLSAPPYQHFFLLPLVRNKKRAGATVRLRCLHTVSSNFGCSTSNSQNSLSALHCLSGTRRCRHEEEREKRDPKGHERHENKRETRRDTRDTRTKERHERHENKRETRETREQKRDTRDTKRHESKRCY